MPQAPSPSMGIIWPTDKDDANAWDVIMDTAIRVVVDGHNHAAGNGAKISISQLAFDADISFVDSGGGKHAITDLKAIDFFPVPASDVTALAGAFFLNSADSELYFRNLSGANIKFTNGATLNSAAFVGGIGGDYQAVAALEIFDDATDAYWFQQQVGTGVRQYAKMRCADLALYEFKTVASGPPVPVLAVTLKSPAALAAGYSLTMPAALQVGALPSALYLSNTGVIGFGGTRTLQLAAATMVGLLGTTITFPAGTLIAQMTGGTAAMGTAIPLEVGKRILAIRIFIADSATGPTKVNAAFSDTTLNLGTAVDIVVGAASAGTGAQQTLALNGLSTIVTAGHAYTAWIKTTSGAAAVTVNGIEIDYDGGP